VIIIDILFSYQIKRQFSRAYPM